MARAPGAKLEHVGVAAGAVCPGAATFDSDLERSWGSLPAPLVAAYPHATDVEARLDLDLERDLRFGWDMWAWARFEAGTGQSSVYYDSVSTASAVPRRFSVCRLGREPLCRTLVCLRPSQPDTLALEHRRSEGG